MLTPTQPLDEDEDASSSALMSMGTRLALPEQVQDSEDEAYWGDLPFAQDRSAAPSPASTLQARRLDFSDSSAKSAEPEPQAECPKGNPNSRCFVGTLNNYADGDRDAVLALPGLKYAVVGKEVAPTTGTPHLQAFFMFERGHRWKTVSKMLDEACGNRHWWLAVAVAAAAKAAKYCKKDGDYKTVGTEPKGRGHRSDLEEVSTAVVEGKSMAEIAKEFPATFVKYSKGLRELKETLAEEEAKDKRKRKFAEVSLRLWQQEELALLLQQNDREVRWVHDAKGGAGKTWFAQYLIAHYNAFYCSGGKTADIAHAWDMQEIVIFDFTREKQELVNYSIIESFKNGLVFSGKYESRMKASGAPIKVIVFANWLPDLSKLSADRWSIRTLTDAERDRADSPGPVRSADDFVFRD